MSINSDNFFKNLIYNGDCCETEQDYEISKCKYSDDGEILEVEGIANKKSTFLKQIDKHTDFKLVLYYEEFFKWRKGRDEEVHKRNVELHIFCEHSLITTDSKTKMPSERFELSLKNIVDFLPEEFFDDSGKKYCSNWRIGNHLDTSIMKVTIFYEYKPITKKEMKRINVLGFFPKEFFTIDYDQFDHEDLKFLGE